MKEGVGKRIRKLTVNYGPCMVFSILSAFVRGIIVTKSYMLVFV